jgi:hypothetical protein
MTGFTYTVNQANVRPDHAVIRAGERRTVQLLGDQQGRRLLNAARLQPDRADRRHVILGVLMAIGIPRFSDWLRNARMRTSPSRCRTACNSPGRKRSGATRRSASSSSAPPTTPAPSTPPARTGSSASTTRPAVRDGPIRHGRPAHHPVTQRAEGRGDDHRIRVSLRLQQPRTATRRCRQRRDRRLEHDRRSCLRQRRAGSLPAHRGQPRRPDPHV